MKFLGIQIGGGKEHDLVPGMIGERTPDEVGAFRRLGQARTAANLRNPRALIAVNDIQLSDGRRVLGLIPDPNGGDFYLKVVEQPRTKGAIVFEGESERVYGSQVDKYLYRNNG